jgi:hypothetical protein
MNKRKINCCKNFGKSTTLSSDKKTFKYCRTDFFVSSLGDPKLIKRTPSLFFGDIDKRIKD